MKTRIKLFFSFSLTALLSLTACNNVKYAEETDEAVEEAEPAEAAETDDSDGREAEQDDQAAPAADGQVCTPVPCSASMAWCPAACRPCRRWRRQSHIACTFSTDYGL